MSTSLALRRSAHTAFKSLIDYAGLFPPAALDMRGALDEYAAAREGPHAWMLGRFIVPISRIGEMGGRSREFPLSVLVNVTLAPDADSGRWVELAGEALAAVARERESGARIESLEVSIPPPRWQRETVDAPLGQLGAVLERENLRDIATYAELPRGAVPSAAAKRARLGVKLRCGGLDASAFPSVETVATFVAAANAEALPFKATAGLHHPVRHLDAATGFTMHGFLNLIAAGAFAPRADEATLAAIVAEEDPSAFTFEDAAFTWRDLRCEVDDLRAMRRSSFVGYGSCSFSEPVDDLTALGILPAVA